MIQIVEAMKCKIEQFLPLAYSHSHIYSSHRQQDICFSVLKKLHFNPFEIFQLEYQFEIKMHLNHITRSEYNKLTFWMLFDFPLFSKQNLFDFPLFSNKSAINHFCATLRGDRPGHKHAPASHHHHGH